MPRSNKLGRSSVRVLRLVLATSILMTVGNGFSFAAKSGKRGKVAAPKQDPRVVKLRGKILELSRMVPLTAEGAAAVLGAKLGPERSFGPGSSRKEWTLGSTDLITGGTVVRFGAYEPKLRVEVVPAPALSLSFNDIASALLDLPYDSDFVIGHGGGDSVAMLVSRVYHTFRVPAGELSLELPAPPSSEAAQFKRTVAEAWDTAQGVAPRQDSVIGIAIGEELHHKWEGYPTLRQRRAQAPKSR